MGTSTIPRSLVGGEWGGEGASFPVELKSGVQREEERMGSGQQQARMCVGRGQQAGECSARGGNILQGANQGQEQRGSKRGILVAEEGAAGSAATGGASKIHRAGRGILSKFVR
jgi:hypothetical protein